MRAGAVLEFLLAQAQADAARLLQGQVGARCARRVSWPGRARRQPAARPALVPRRAEALGLHPDQADVAARCAEGNVALIQQHRVEALLAQPVRDGRAHQPAADDDGVAGHAARRLGRATMPGSAARRFTQAATPGQRARSSRLRRRHGCRRTKRGRHGRPGIGQPVMRGEAMLHGVQRLRARLVAARQALRIRGRRALVGADVAGDGNIGSWLYCSKNSHSITRCAGRGAAARACLRQHGPGWRLDLDQHRAVVQFQHRHLAEGVLAGEVRPGCGLPAIGVDHP